MQNPSPRVFRFLRVLTIVASLTPGAFGQIPASTWVQLTPVHNPQRRGAPAMAYDPVSQKIVMFGGYGRASYYGDTWTFDGTDWKKQRVTVAPSPRAAAGMAFDVTLQKLVLFGGWNGPVYRSAQRTRRYLRRIRRPFLQPDHLAVAGRQLAQAVSRSVPKRARLSGVRH